MTKVALRLNGPRRPAADGIAAVMLALCLGAVAGVSREAPGLAGMAVVLGAGVLAWACARAAAPRAAANDNALLRSRNQPRHAIAGPQTIGERTMFGSGDTKDRTQAARRPNGGLSVIGADVTVTGNIATDGDLHIDGTVAGDIACGALVQGASSRIVGTVTAKAARLAGTIEGAVSVVALTIEKSARLRGDAAYRTLQIDTGAQVDGRMSHLVDGQAAAPDSPLRLVDASDAAG